MTKEIISAEFQSLGFSNCFSISASHGHGVQPFLSYITKDLADDNPEEEKQQGIKITVVGRPNVGKSTLINRILGEERLVVFDSPGTTRDSIAVPFHRDEQDYVFIDTAGIRRKSRVNEKIEKFSVIKTLQSIKQADVCLFLMNAKEGVTDQDLHLIGFIIEAGKSLLF